MDWIPPCFAVPQKIKEIIKKYNLNSDVLYQIMIPRDDKFSGKLNQMLLYYIFRIITIRYKNIYLI